MNRNSAQVRTRNLQLLLWFTSLFLLLVVHNQAEAQIPRFLWAKTFPTNQSEATAIATDRYGNTYVTGSFRDRMDLEGLVLTNGGVFVLKLDRDGAVVWARQAGTNRCEGRGVGVDSEGNPIVICDFYDMGNVPLPIAGTNVSGRVILAKYDTDGNGLWARRIATVVTGTINDMHLGLFQAGAAGAVRSFEYSERARQ